jgi:hypothetical protein
MSVMLANFPEESKIVGSILTWYGDMEYQLMRCVGSVLDNNQAAIRCMFRLRGGNVRIQVADAIIRPSFNANGLKDQYESALGAIRGSTSIRNQYAHCHWLDGKKEGLFFTDLEKAAKSAEGDLSFGMRHIDLPLLKLQLGYVLYATQWTWYLHHEYRLRVGKSSIRTHVVPKIIPVPPLHNPIEKHPRPRPMKDDPPPPADSPAADH